MADIKLEISDENLKQAVAESLLLSLGADQRDTLIRQAIQYLLTPQKEGSSYYSQQSTPIQQAFQNAMRSASYDIARKMVEEMPDVQEKLKALMADAYVIVFEKQREQTVEKLAASLVEALNCHPRDR